jgi:multidrug efflux pump subunit AcrB
MMDNSGQGNMYHGLIAWFAHNPVAANLLMASLIAAGLWSALTVKKETMPSIDPNNISIRVAFNGATPAEVEQGVLIKIEEAIQDIEGIDKLTSYGREGSGTVNVSVLQDYDIESILNEIKLRVDGISTFPAETEEPVISKSQWTSEVMWISVFGEVNERTLKEFAKQVRNELVQLPGVTRAEVVGGRDYELNIEVSEQTLRKYDLTMDEVAQAIRRSSLDLSAGSIESSTGNILLRTQGQAYTGIEFEKIVLRSNPDGTRITLGDIARIDDGFVDRDRYVMHNGKPAIAIRVMSVGNQSELLIAESVRDYLKKKQASLPSGIGAESWADASVYLRDRLDMMNGNLITGAILVFLMLSLFLRLKLAFWVMMGLPIAFLGTLWLMLLMGISINMLSLFGFILVLGIVVDDAIIIGESVYTKIRKDGHSIDNVVAGAMEVAVPATFGVLTTVAAFLPIVLISGIYGQFMSPIGWVVIFALIFSLIESKLILPAHLAHMQIRPIPEHAGNGFLHHLQFGLLRVQRRFAGGLHHFVDNYFVHFVRKAVINRYLTVSVFIAMLILAFGLIAGGLLRVVVFPDWAGDFIRTNVEMREGTTAGATHAALDRIDNALTRVDAEISGEHGLPPGSIVKTRFIWSGSDTTGTMIVELTPSASRPVDVGEISRRWRSEIGEIAGARSINVSADNGPGGGAAVSFNLVGNDLGQLQAAAAELTDKLRGYDGTFDVQNSYEGGNREVKLDIKPEAEALGLTLTNLATQVRQAFYGAEAQRIQRGEDEVRVMVRYPEAERDSIGNLEDMRIRTPAGDAVPFSTVADVNLSSSPTIIRRFNRERAIAVSAEVDKTVSEPGKIASDVQQNVIPALFAKYPDVGLRLDGNTEEQGELMTELKGGFLFAAFLIYALLAVPLRSYLKPVLIMSVIPFGMIGALVGHLILGLDVSILSMFGIVALAGVVVNDSLILVDFIGRARAAGMGLIEAVVDASGSRFRAIVLTSATTFIGLFPIVFLETSAQAEGIVPMAASLAFGILFSTVNTLIMIPALYVIGSQFKRWLRKEVSIMLGRPQLPSTSSR